MSYVTNSLLLASKKIYKNKSKANDYSIWWKRHKLKIKLILSIISDVPSPFLGPMYTGKIALIKHNNLKNKFYRVFLVL